jgi:hypothetical protein
MSALIMNGRSILVDLSVQLKKINNKYKTCKLNNSRHYFHECFLTVFALIRGNNNRSFAFTLEELNAVCKLTRQNGNYLRSNHKEQWGFGNNSYIVKSFREAESCGWVTRISNTANKKYNYYEDQWVLTDKGLIEGLNYVF